MKVNGSIQLYPLLRVVLALGAGILLGSVLGNILSPYVWLMAMFISLLMAFVVNQRPILQSVVILLTILLFGVWRFSIRSAESRKIIYGDYIYKAVVVSRPIVIGKVLKCDLLIASGAMVNKKIKAAILRDTVSRRYLRLRLGDGIVVRSVLEKPKNYYLKSHSDYTRWLRIRGFEAQTFIYYTDWHKAKVPLLEVSRLERLRLKSQKLREKLLSQYGSAGLDQQNYAIVAAMTLGDKTMLSKSMKTDFSVAGASHLLALSGLHLGIIYFIFTFFCLGFRRHLLIQIFILLAVWTYVVIVGMTPSVFRSAIMLTIYAFVALLNRKRMSLNVLALAAIVILIANPLVLWDVGFQLSFMAVLGILVCYSPIFHLVSEKYLFDSYLLKWLWSMIAVSISAQLGTAALVMYYFGNFSCYFFLTNLFAIPLATLILYSAFVLIIFAPLPAVQSVIGNFLSVLVNLLNNGITAIASLPGSHINNISINFYQVILIYVLFCCLYGVGCYGRKIVCNNIKH